jgi:hypothetical protein
MLTGIATATASAAEAGIITKWFGRDYPTLATCDQQGANAMAREHADGWNCLRYSDGKWDGYIYWRT